MSLDTASRDTVISWDVDKHCLQFLSVLLVSSMICEYNETME